MIVDACIYIYILYFISYTYSYPPVWVWLKNGAPASLAPRSRPHCNYCHQKFVHSTSAHSRKIHLCYIPIKKKESVFNQKAPIGDGSSPTDLFLFCVIGDGIKPSLQVT